MLNPTQLDLDIVVIFHYFIIILYYLSALALQLMEALKMEKYHSKMMHDAHLICG